MKPPIITIEPGSGEWTLVSPFHAEVNGHTVVIPAGFRFDLASVPRILWWLVAPFHLSIAAPLVHDWLYRRGGWLIPGGARVARSDADRVFRDLMRQYGVNPVVAFLAWVVVRVFGWVAWRRNAYIPETSHLDTHHERRLPNPTRFG